MQTVPEHEADCPICQAGHKDHCTDREVAKDFAELRAQLAAAESERDRYLTRACVAEAKVEQLGRSDAALRRVLEFCYLQGEIGVSNEAKFVIGYVVHLACGGKP